MDSGNFLYSFILIFNIYLFNIFIFWFAFEKFYPFSSFSFPCLVFLSKAFIGSFFFFFLFLFQ